MAPRSATAVNEATLPLTLHASAWPEAQRTALLEALRAGRVPGAHLYQSPAQAQRWLAYHAAWSPSRADAALHEVYAAAARAAAARVSGPALVLGLGSGGGRKDARLLAALTPGARGAPLHYAPVDASAALAAEAALHVRAERPGTLPHLLVADLETLPALGPWLAGTGVGALPRVLTCYGMLPNMDAGRFPAWVAGLLRAEDALLISANLSPRGLATDGARIAAQYDNPPARAWYAGALSELGVAAAAHALEIGAEPLPAPLAGLPANAAWQVAVRARLREALTLAVHGERLDYPAGQRLAVFHSLRFTAEGARALLEGAGLRVRERWLGAGGEEGVFLCTRG
jgi:uncharacterized SAM-dependent methyltransferase